MQLYDPIPSLMRLDQRLWGLAICTVSGQRFAVGDAQVHFALESMCKPFNYALMLDNCGPAFVHELVSHELNLYRVTSLNFNNK